MEAADDLIREVQRIYDGDSDAIWTRPSAADIRRYAPAVSGGEQALIDGISEALARGFKAGLLSFNFCDRMVNRLWYLLIHDDTWSPKPPMSKLFVDVYLAFDEGEYTHRGDDRSLDPEEAYTQPLIREILDRLDSRPE